MISRLTSNSHGFGYIQVLLTSSAIAGLALFGMRLAKEHEEVIDHSYKKKLTYYVTQEINHLLKDEKNCSSSLKGYSPVNSYITHLINVKSEERLNAFFLNQQFFNNKITINNIKLYGKREDARLDDGLTFLDISFNLDDSEKVVKRSLPIFFKQASDGSISSCFSQSPGVFAAKDKYWKNINGHTHSMLPRVELIPVRNLSTNNITWENHGGVSFDVKKLAELEVCNDKVKGILTFTHTYGPTICKNNKWRRLGQRQASWHLREDYELNISKSGSKKLVIRDFKYCFLVDMIKKSLSEGCLLKKENAIFTLTAFSSEYISSLKCKVSCVK
jgi:hypothetical protein